MLLKSITLKVLLKSYLKYRFGNATSNFPLIDCGYFLYDLFS